MPVRSTLLIAALVALTAACGPREISLACRPMDEPKNLGARSSPYD